MLFTVISIKWSAMYKYVSSSNLISTFPTTYIPDTNDTLYTWWTFDDA